MKKFILIPFGILYIIFFCSCSGDTMGTNDNPPPSITLKTVTAAGNPANPYDGIGQNFTAMLSAYKDSDYDPSAFEDIAMIVRILTKQTETESELLQAEQLLSLCISHPYDTSASLLGQSELSPQARDITGDLVGNFETLGNQSFDVSYGALVNMEDTVTASAILSLQEKRVILTLASVIRYSLYHSCCEDTDWEKSVGNIVAALAGILEDDSLATAYPVATSIAGLEKIEF
ncbi:hypothetical protein ABS768_04480 [Flavobacterium sp. ST-75]|uniref:Lipoprotein n=1 Tax=Flavobacterium rhizophilum TaxID=3163296 RepID=A0ABW8YA84_9FLAO